MDDTHLVITLHGIRTFGGWQERLENLLRAREPGIEVCNYRYNYVSALGFIFPPVRWLIMRRFRRELIRTCSRSPRNRIDIVAHSMGTHIAAWALHGLPRAEQPRIHTIVFAGSVLRSTFPWSDMMPTPVQRVVNDCGTRDDVLILSQFFSLFTGMAGRLGFVGMQNTTFINRYFDIGHSGYFRDERGDSDQFMTEHWIPLLTSETPAVRTPPRPAPTAVQGIFQFLIDNAEPIKLALYVLPLLLIILWINGLRRTAISRQYAAEATSSLFLDPKASIRKAVAAADLADTNEAYQAVEKAFDQSNVVAVLRDHDALLHATDATVPASGAAFSSDGKWILTSNSRERTWLWRVPDLQIGRGPFQSRSLLRISRDSLSPDGREILTSGWRLDKATNRGLDLALWWNSDTGDTAELPASFVGPLTSASFSPKGTYVVTAGWDYSVTIWTLDAPWHVEPVAKRRVLNTWQNRHKDIINSARFSPDERRVVTASQDGVAKVWDVESRSMVPLRKGTTALFSAEFSPVDPNVVLTAGQDGHADLWDVRNPQHPKQELGNHKGDISQASFSLDGSKIVTASYDQTAEVWDVHDLSRQPTLLFVLRGHQGGLTGAGFSPDGQFIVTSSVDGTIRVWRTEKIPEAQSHQQKLDYLKKIAK